MSDEETLYDRVPADRHIDLVRMRQAKLCDDSRPSWTWCLAIAALVVGVLKLVGAI
jgi:hypothetical protein